MASDQIAPLTASERIDDKRDEYEQLFYQQQEVISA
jgi:hypothetical protein